MKINALSDNVPVLSASVATATTKPKSMPNYVKSSMNGWKPSKRMVNRFHRQLQAEGLQRESRDRDACSAVVSMEKFRNAT
jgi:hypothetical protein